MVADKPKATKSADAGEGVGGGYLLYHKNGGGTRPDRNTPRASIYANGYLYITRDLAIELGITQRRSVFLGVTEDRGSILLIPAELEPDRAPEGAMLMSEQHDGYRVPLKGFSTAMNLPKVFFTHGRSLTAEIIAHRAGKALKVTPPKQPKQPETVRVSDAEDQ